MAVLRREFSELDFKAPDSPIEPRSQAHAGPSSIKINAVLG